jgi:23S rRNA (cytidine1920-2'-O)/16S rRNA (cytidine1409-2'-O)-methyltransferase
MRLDVFLTEKYNSRNKAGEAIKRGEVLYNDQIVKPSQIVKNEKLITFSKPLEYFVSNGGYKLSKALKDFNISVNNLIIADIGASTGGFTDCLLQNNAKKVYAIDVGESQLNEQLKNDTRVIIKDNTNARYLSNDLFEEKLDCIVMDVSFISIKLILPKLVNVLENGKILIILIKPQFECENKNINKNGIVTDKKTRKKILLDIIEYCNILKLYTYGIINAPIKAEKNIEYLIYLKKSEKSSFKNSLLDILP